MTSFTVDNLGPLQTATVAISPLTVFIGPNNSGKSYMAYMIYTFYKTLVPGVQSPLYVRAMFDHFERLRRYEPAIKSWIRQSYRSREQHGSDWFDLTPELKDALIRTFNRILSSTQFRDALDEMISDNFGCEHVSDLSASKSPDKMLTVTIRRDAGSNPILIYKAGARRRKSQVRPSLPYDAEIPLDVGRLYATLNIADDDIVIPFCLAAWSSLWIYLDFPVDVYYLPASRSGIFQGLHAYTSFAIAMLRQRAGIERIDVPSFSGILGDFLQTLSSVLARPRSSIPEELKPAASILSRDVLHGDIGIEEGQQGVSQITYTNDGVHLPIQRTSSMLGELAPLDLWIKNVLDPGDLLIIDEPEAHVHPRGQRTVARCLVRLANANVGVISTTHSSYMLHQLSNHLLASSSEPDDRQRVGMEEQDVINTNDIGVYVFSTSETGTIVKPVPIEPAFGIPEDEFVSVAEEIGEQTDVLTRSLSLEAHVPE